MEGKEGVGWIRAGVKRDGIDMGKKKGGLEAYGTLGPLDTGIITFWGGGGVLRLASMIDTLDTLPPRQG